MVVVYGVCGRDDSGVVVGVYYVFVVREVFVLVVVIYMLVVVCVF